MKWSFEMALTFPIKFSKVCAIAYIKQETDGFIDLVQVGSVVLETFANRSLREEQMIREATDHFAGLVYDCVEFHKLNNVRDCQLVNRGFKNLGV
jgi:hypothetical protein